MFKMLAIFSHDICATLYILSYGLHFCIFRFRGYECGTSVLKEVNDNVSVL